VSVCVCVREDVELDEMSINLVLCENTRDREWVRE